MTALAALFGHVPFEPHITVQGDLSVEPRHLVAIAREEANRTSALSWPSFSFGRSDFFYRALFLEFPDTVAFAALAERLTLRTGTSVGCSPFPHLSLAYGHPDPNREPAVAEILARCELKTKDFRFDRLAVVLSAQSVPLDRWQILESFTLLSGAVDLDAVRGPSP